MNHLYSHFLYYQGTVSYGKSIVQDNKKKKRLYLFSQEAGSMSMLCDRDKLWDCVSRLLEGELERELTPSLLWLPYATPAETYVQYRPKLFIQLAHLNLKIITKKFISGKETGIYQNTANNVKRASALTKIINYVSSFFFFTSFFKVSEIIHMLWE